jgi:hypothetical protein
MQDTSAMAFTAAPTISDQLKEFLANQITAEIRCVTNASKPPIPGKDNKDGKQRTRPSHQDWLYIAPQNIEESKIVNNCTYRWCSKCNRGNGQWVITHSTDTHKDDYIHPSKRQDDTKRSPTQQTVNTAQVLQPQPTSADGGTTPQGQLSLQDGITNAFRFHVTDYEDED